MNSGIGVPYRVTYVCEACQTLAKETGEEIEVCRHNLDAIPHYIDDSKFDKIKVIFGAENQRQYMIETQGLDPQDADPFVFELKHVDQFVNGPRTVPMAPIEVTFTSVDPSAGSDKDDKRTSDFAIITIGSPGNIVLAMDAIDAVKPEDYEEILVNHIKRVRKLEFCSASTCVVDVESGTGMEAGHIRRLISRNFSRVVFMTDFTRKPGRKTTQAVKEEMALLTHHFLKTGSLAFHSKWVTSAKDPAKLLGSLRSQLATYSRIIKVNLQSTNSITYTGKGHNKKARDDLAVVLQKCLKARADFYADPKYLNIYQPNWGDE